MSRCRLTMDAHGHVRLIDHRGRIVDEVHLSTPAVLPPVARSADRLAAIIIACMFAGGAACLILLWLL